LAVVGWLPVSDDHAETDRRLVAELLAFALADSNLLYFSDLESIIRDVGLSRNETAEFVDALTEGGITVGGSDDVEDDEEFWIADLSQHFFSRLKHELLSREEEIELGLQIQRGREAAETLMNSSRDPNPVLPEIARELRRNMKKGADAEETFALSNLRLARSVASRYAAAAGYSLTIDDLFQECYFALNHAVYLWDPNRGFRFSTYAMSWIRQVLQRQIANQSRVIRLPVHVHEDLRKIKAAESAFELDHQRIPTPDEVASIQNEPIDRVVFLLKLSEDALLFPWPEGVRHLSDEVDFNYWNHDDETWLFKTVVVEVVAEALEEVLNMREREVLTRRFGFGGDEPETLEAIGDSYRVTRERIRQIESKALLKLKDSSYGPTLAFLIGFNFFEEVLPQEQRGAPWSAPTESANTPLLVNLSDSMKTSETSQLNSVERDPAETFREKYGFDLEDDFVIDVDGVKPASEYIFMEDSARVGDVTGVETTQELAVVKSVAELAQRLQVVDDLHSMGLLSDSEKARKRAEIISEV